MPLPGYPTFRLGLGSAALRRWLAEHRAEVVHLASPFVLGARGMAAARQLRLPTVAVYQTDVPGYARAYRLGAAAEAAAWRWVRRIHNAADRTLAPSTASAERLRAHGIERVWLWGRGVDCQRFNPAHRSESLRRSLAPRGEVLVGYVGRLANEKRVDLLAPVAGLPGTRLIIVGGGPAEERLRRAHAGRGLPRPAPAASSWPGSSPASTCSCTAAATRRSARPSRKRRPAGCRWSRRPWAAPSTWSRTASPDTWCRPATLPRWPGRRPGWWPTRGPGRRRAARPGSGCWPAAGPLSVTR